MKRGERHGKIIAAVDRKHSFCYNQRIQYCRTVLMLREITDE